MATYRPIKVCFWSDEFIASISPNAKLLYLYLLTNERTTLCGIYRLPIQYLYFETGLNKPQIDKSMQELAPKIIYKDGWIVIKNFSKHQSNSPKIAAGVRRELVKIPLEIANLRYPIDTLSKHIDKPEPKLKPKLSSKEETSMHDFENFWSNYPKKKSKGKAEKAFQKVTVPIGTILDAIKKFKETEDWKKQGGQFIPYPATWLNAKGWEDVPGVEIEKGEDFYVSEFKRLGLDQFALKYGIELAKKYNKQINA